MSGRSIGIVLALVVLLALALLLRREPREVKPSRPPKPVAATEPPPPEPVPVAAAPEPPKPEPPRPAPPKPPEIPPVVPGPEIKAGTVRGTVKILGAPPRRRPVRMAADPKCAALHPGEVLSDDIVADPEGNVCWAFVYVSQGNVQAAPEPLPPVLLEQTGCRFEPHVLGIQVNQPLNIVNNDPLLHNVHALPFANREFNFAQPQIGLIETKRFERKEVMVRMKCDVHPWMSAWIGVLDHPHFSVTSETGAYGIVNLPPGRFKITVWHERYASVEREVDVPSGGDARLDFLLDARKSE